MVLRQKLTPEVFLSAPSRSAAVPSPSGRLAYFTVSTHTFREDGNVKGTTRKELLLLDLATGEHWPLALSDYDGEKKDEETEKKKDGKEEKEKTPEEKASAYWEKADEINWIPGTKNGRDQLLWLRPRTEKDHTEDDEAGFTEVVVVTVPTTSKEAETPVTPYVAAIVPAPISALKLKALPESGAVAFAAAGLVGKDGALFNEKAAPPKVDGATGGDNHGDVAKDAAAGAASSSPASSSEPRKKGSTARVYDSWQVREWASYLKAQRYSIWYSSLVRKKSSSEGESSSAEPRWQLSTPLHNALRLADPAIEAPSGIYEPGDASSSFDIGAQGLVFVGRDPSLRHPTEVACSVVYYVPLDSFAAAAQYKPTRIFHTVTDPSLSSSQSNPYNPPGFSANPRFSPDGSQVAFLWAPLAAPADIRLHLGHLVAGAAADVRVIVGAASEGNNSGTDAPANSALSSSSSSPSIVPDEFEFAPSGQAVFLGAPDLGRRRVFLLDLQPGARPRLVTRQPQGSVSSFYVVRRPGSDGAAQTDSLSSYGLLVSGSSFVESSFYHYVDLADYDYGRDPGAQEEGGAFEPRVVSVASKDGARYGLSYKKQVAEMYFEGGGNSGERGDGGDDEYVVQAWVVKPSDFDPEKKYPLALLVHGGPEGDWSDEWQGRWNAALWAEQGYVAVLPNVTGSVGFGLAHTKRVYGNWGGSPYEDLVKAMAALRDVPYLDFDRAVVAGASYGGYMVNWILGSPLAKEFKAAVTHDGVFTTAIMSLTSDYNDGLSTFRGSPYLWENFDDVDRWSPAKPERLRNWGRNAPPTLVVHSDQDYRCPVDDGLAVFRSLQFQGVPSRYLNFPDECHFVQKKENSLVWHRTIFEWVNRWSAAGAQTST